MNTIGPLSLKNEPNWSFC